jgi:hypothetical protein
MGGAPALAPELMHKAAAQKIAWTKRNLVGLMWLEELPEIRGLAKNKIRDSSQ